MSTKVEGLEALDLRFELHGVAGTDARHRDPVYSFATCVLRAGGLEGTGFALTLGRGNELVTRAIRCYEPMVLGRDLDDIVGGLGSWWSAAANESQLRWVGPHKGVTHLALAAVTGALVDLWAKAEGKPLWRLLLDLTPEQVVSLIDFSTVRDLLTEDDALALLRDRRLPQGEVDDLLRRGYPAYDTSVGWLGYSAAELVERADESRAGGYRAMKLKVGSDRIADDVARVAAVRSHVGDGMLLMVDANQRWGVAEAVEAGRALAPFDPFWFEEPVHPDDVVGYRSVRHALAPMRIAGGEHLANQVQFKIFIQLGALDVVQADVVRLGGLPEYLAVALMAAKAGLPVLPHVGDMGQVHQHLITFTRCALGMPELPLEMIPHVARHFAEPCEVHRGRYVLPQRPGASSTFTREAVAQARRS